MYILYGAVHHIEIYIFHPTVKTHYYCVQLCTATLVIATFVYGRVVFLSLFPISIHRPAPLTQFWAQTFSCLASWIALHTVRHVQQTKLSKRRRRRSFLGFGCFLGGWILLFFQEKELRLFHHMLYKT